MKTLVPEPKAVVFVVDDDDSVREALSGLVQSAGLHAVACASAGEFLRCPRVNAPSCLVLDVRLPGLNGLELQSHLAEINRELPIIFITGHVDVPMTVRAMKAGAIEFLVKPFREQDLLATIHQALARDRSARSQAAQRQALRERYDALTLREKEVMAKVVAGLANKCVAADLGISEITVKVHRAQAMHKMHARSLPDLVRMGETLRTMK